MTHVPYRPQPPSRAPTPHPTSQLTNPTQSPNIEHPAVNSTSHPPVNTINRNSPQSITAVHNVNTEHIDHTAHNPPPPTNITTVNTVNRTSTYTAAPYTTDAHSPASPTFTPTHLYDLLTPHLLHQHATLSAVQALLTPLPPTAPTPLSTLHTLRRILSDSPKLLALLPHVNNPNHILNIHPPQPTTLKDIHTTAHDAPIVNNPLSEHHTQHALPAPTDYPSSSRPPGSPLPQPIPQHSPLAVITDNLSPLLSHLPPSPPPSIAPPEQLTTHPPTPPLSPLQLYDRLSPHLLHHQSLTTPAYLYDLLTPHILHQHSIRTAVYDLLLPLPPSSPTPISTLHTLHKLLSDSPRLHSLLPPLPPPPTPPPRAPPRARPLRAPPISYADPTEPHPFPMPCPMSFPFGDTDGVAAAPSTLSTPDSDAGLGLFGIRPKKSSYANSKQHRHLFAKKGDYICSYHGPIRTSAECISQPSMYLFSDPMDPQQRYIDSWDPSTGVTSYGGLVNESFHDEDINCTIKWIPGTSTAGQCHPSESAKCQLLRSYCPQYSQFARSGFNWREYPRCRL